MIHHFCKPEEVVTSNHVFWGFWIYVVRIVELHGGETATIDVKVNIPLLEIGCNCFPYLCAGVKLLYLFPYFLAGATRLNPVLHVQKVQMIVLCEIVYDNNYATDDLPILCGFIGNRTLRIK